MSQDLDNILHNMSTAASTCYDLNGNGELTTPEQTVFYQYAEHTILLLGQIHADYDAIADGLADPNNAPAKTELNQVWDLSNSDLREFAKSTTSPKMRAAVSSTAFAIDRTGSILQSIVA